MSDTDQRAGADWRRDPRYYPFSRFLRERFPWKVYKVAIDAGFTCPNRDGTKGVGGCIYCVNESFCPNTGRGERSIAEQMQTGMAVLRRRYGAEKFIAYFQAFTNTYAPVEKLRALYDEALALDDVVGLSVGTRPDCVDDEILDTIASYADRFHVWVEYGLQSAHDETLDAINRGHGFEEFARAVEQTARRGLYVCAHVILGLPGETRSMMMETARRLAALPLSGVKLHHLYVARGTPLADIYERGEFETLSAAQYASLAAAFLERIPPTVAVQRLVGDVTSDVLIAPKWSEPKQQVITMVTADLASRDTCQGALCEQAETRSGSRPTCADGPRFYSG